MTTAQDVSVGLGIESTYGTSVTPTRWLEFTSEDLQWRKAIKQGEGLRVGARVDRSARRVFPTADGGGSVAMEYLPKGLGLLLQAAMGTGSSTLVSTGLYQQVFTLPDTPVSATIQKGLPRADGSTVDAYTFLGCVCESVEFDFASGEIVKISTSWDAKDVSSAIGYAAPSYATSPAPLHFGGATISTGTLTAPTATTLASAPTPLAGVRGGTLTVSHNLQNGRYNIGGGGRKDRPLVGKRTITGKLSVELAAAAPALRTAILTDSPITIVYTVTVGTDVLQLVLPEVKIDGDLPTANGGDQVMQDVNFTVLDGLVAAQPIWVVTRTSDTAL